ncbi:MAG: hypothetical protein KAT86_06955 [Candidatus Latescibacteria bacterium]|nr:hypothetical protein [Candidatus Latescibacterota bacterium]
MTIKKKRLDISSLLSYIYKKQIRKLYLTASDGCQRGVFFDRTAGQLCSHWVVDQEGM